MRFILLGAPGVGKGTQAAMLAEHYGLVSLSTGEMLRQAVDSSTELGTKVKSVIESGHLVDDYIVEQIVKERLVQKDCSNGFIIDGFPRTVSQAVALDDILKRLHKDDIYVIFIDMTEDDLRNRLRGRILCAQCKSVYNTLFFKAEEESICPSCASREFIHRPDDDDDAVHRRFVAYREKTAPIVDFYSKHPGFIRVNGALSIEQVFRSIVDRISKVMLTFV